MNKNLEHLIELSNFDKNIDSFTPKIEAIQKKLDDKEASISEIENQINTVLIEIDDVKSQITATNAHIAEFSAKIKSAGKKSSSIKTEKELKALQTEEEFTKEQLNAANEDISKLERLIDTKEGIKKELDSKKEILLKEFEALKIETKVEFESIEKAKNEFSVKKSKLIKEMDQKIISFYEKIRKWAGNSAVAKVKKQACYGCFLHINDKTYFNVIRGEEIITCPHCGRILYKDTQED